MRLFAATLATETNTFSPLPTSLAAYKESVFYPARRAPARFPAHVHGTAVRRPPARRRGGFTLVEGSCFAASPAGTTNRADYEFMRDEILGQLQAAMPVDGVLLGLHGAMVAYGYDDVEGDIIERARAIVGKGCVIGVELDPHCHLTLKRMLRLRHHRLLQGIPAHRRGRARRGCARARAGQAQGQDQAGHVALRLPADADVPDHRAADARVRRPYQERWRARTASCRSPSCTASPTPMCPRTRAACW